MLNGLIYRIGEFYIDNVKLNTLEENLMLSAVSRIPAGSSEEAKKHFSALLAHETDCWDVNHAVSNNRKDFVFLDVRREESYQKGHLLGQLIYPTGR